MDQIALSITCVQCVQEAEEKGLSVGQCAMIQGSSGLGKVIVLLQILFKL